MFRIGGQKAEYIVHRACDFWIGSEQAQVRVNACRARVVIPSSQVSIAAGYSVWIPAHQER